jgi:hypothetical protein
VTTQREIYADLGEPIRSGIENGLETWIYSHQYDELGQLRDSKALYFVFEDNTVRSYSFTGR